MIPVSEALEQVLGHARPLRARRRRLAEALSFILGEDVVSSTDSPPYDKSLMDGYALRMDDVRDGAELFVLEQVTAGETPCRALEPGGATRIMTGAPIPDGAEVVVPVEHTQSLDEGARLKLVRCVVKLGDNILRQGTAMRAGQSILQRGRELRPMELGLLAEMGAAEVSVLPRPRIAILATGNELVAHEQTPGAGQIRNSNGPMLVALAARAQGEPIDLGIARDTAEDLKHAIVRGLKADVLVMSGGVSAGVLDLIPAVLEQLGVRPVFHQIDLKPGKPLWFGTYQSDDHRCLVFGLPGNPVSSLVCFELFVKPALAQLSGRNGKRANRITRAALSAAHEHRDTRLTYFPAFYEPGEDQGRVTPLPWKGSADLRTLVDANALVIFRGGPRRYSLGEVVEVHLL